MIVALAGRRIDALDASVPRFPSKSVEKVRADLAAAFQARSATALVCSAACGADLLALDEAAKLRIRCRVILPFARQRFRSSSVTDRPGDWGALFDAICADVATRGDLIELKGVDEGDRAYAATNLAILGEAAALATHRSAELSTSSQPPSDVVALIVWEGRPRGGGDLTAQFREQAAARGLEVVEILTLVNQA